MVELNVLDYAMIDEGKNAEQALHDTIRLAQLADRLCFKRFWITEHHNVPAFACSSPELLMMHILGKTSHIKVGSGGIMLPHYSPYKVAENFRMLEAFYPGRVDLGIGNNPGTPAVKRAMDEDKSEYLDYQQSIVDLRHYLTNQQSEQHFSSVMAQPNISHHPDMWLLSISQRSAKMAAQQGMGFAVGTFLLPDTDSIRATQHSIAAYRQHFEITSLQMSPSVMLTVFVIVTDTEKEATRLLQALDVWLLGKRYFAEFERFPSYETALQYQPTARDKARMQASHSKILAGTITQVTPKLDAMIQDFQADEVLVVPLLPNIENRCRTLELLAQAYL